RMKSLLILGFLFTSIAHADELKLHVIRPKYKINWSSPMSLALTTGLDSIRKDYAPIGHFIVDLKCSRPNRYGVRHVITGMERENKKESQQIVLKQKLGLGSLIYPFKGAIQSSKTSLHEMELAKKDGRMRTLRIPTTPQRCEMDMRFLEQWIENGSYSVYGGGKETHLGEGGGCADFAMSFVKIITQEEIPRSWQAQVLIPHKLIGDGK